MGGGGRRARCAEGAGATARTAAWVVAARVVRVDVRAGGRPRRRSSLRAGPGWPRTATARAQPRSWCRPCPRAASGVDPPAVAPSRRHPSRPGRRRRRSPPARTRRSGPGGASLTLGGFWNPATWPGERRRPRARLRRAGRRGRVARPRPGAGWPAPRGTVRHRAWSPAAASVCVLAGAGATPGLAAVLRSAQAHVPGGGILRDGQKFLVPFVLLVAVERRPGGRAAVRPYARWAPLAALLVAVPVLVLPEPRLGGRRAAVGRSTTRPSGWLCASRSRRCPARRRRLAAVRRTYRRPAGTATASPSTRCRACWTASCSSTTTCRCRRSNVHGEDPRAAAVSAALSGRGADCRPCCAPKASAWRSWT